MHVGHGHFFQNLDDRSDEQVWRMEMGLADAAESLGYESVWAVEHHFAGYSMSTDPLQFLTWVAGRTTTVKLGTMVSVLPWHDPVRLAEHVCVLDHLSQGRLIFGMGRGLARAEFDGFDVPMAQSRELFDTYAAELLGAFVTGKIRGVELRPRPLAPLLGRVYASSISPASAETLARVGAGMMIFLQKPWEQTIADVQRYAEQYRRHQNTEPPKPIVVIFNACHEDRSVAEELFEQVVEYYRSTIDHYGFADASVASIPGYEYYGNIARTIAKHGREQFARFLADLQPWGTPDEVVAQIREIVAKTGAGGLIVVSAFGTLSAQTAAANQERFARKVLPAIKMMGPSGG
ncbi:alkane 1-monooxygenase [Mycobacterium sp. CBMA 234]|uniref:LLM class flavin-dependent oxidoreductase n=1 Tax=Mycolicibacterium sp. CBMA 234 TaxID=1918495 RepID=UPI0012DD4078|nr:LLM class flavin-dependent oxidoreductase [Mycolicibacterium sp. CBMA 234]MUL65912.1 alkane 1-monooxygenase [Mycolicibacterium sp. CBMA 234]